MNDHAGVPIHGIAHDIDHGETAANDQEGVAPIERPTLRPRALAQLRP
jgi:hypothetical protein